jgi:hypothetical protein
VCEYIAVRPIHPNNPIPLFASDYDVHASSSRSTDFRVVPWCRPPAIDLEVFCENQPRQVRKVRFGLKEFLSGDPCVTEARPDEGES